MFSSFEKWLARLVMLAALSFLVLTTFFLYLEEPPLVYLNTPFPTVATIKPGERLPFKVNYCNNSSHTIIYTLTRTLMDVVTGAPTVLASVVVHLAPGCQLVTSLATAIPADLPEGKYKVLGLTILEGTLRTFNIPWETTIFEVTP